jgi:uncharacterized protein (TIGR00255 family)
MAQSMTAFARVETQESWGEAIWEIKSVNHRFLDVNLRVPDSFRSHEMKWRELLRGQLKRGKVECTLIYKSSPNSASELKIDEQLVGQLIQLNSKIAYQADVDSQLNPIDILRWPDVVSVQERKQQLEQPLTQLLDKAVSELISSRQREGQACVEVINDRLVQINEQVTVSQSFRPEIEKHFRERLATKLEELTADIDSNRFEQEILMFLQRTDVAEELDRLKMHIKEVTRVLEQEGAIGRRLDFMMQELNREANTLASKSPNPHLTQAAVEIKVCIEQIREQIQNVE